MTILRPRGRAGKVTGMYTVRTLREGLVPISVLLLLLAVFAVLSPLAALVPLLLLLFTVAFFRDPARLGGHDPGSILAPADGKVVDLGPAAEDRYLRARGTRIGIFLSVFDVHVQRSPIEGEVRFVHYQPGGHLDARDPRAAAVNECRTLGIEAADGFRITVRQLAGKVARRIVGWAQAGDRLAQGERLGMIRFGSRVELYLPPEVEIEVRVGQHVRGGETVLARRK